MSSEQNKFKHILQVPNIISDQALLQRHKTFQTYVKKAHSDLYYLQLKKIGGLRKSIGEKADYGQVIQQIKSNRLQNEYINQQKKNQGFMYNNQLWSDKYYNQIFQMTRLSQISEIISQQKTKGRDQLIKDFEKYFEKKIQPRIEVLGDGQKNFPISTCTTKSSSRVNSLRQIMHSERKLTSRHDILEEELKKTTSCQTSLHEQVTKQIENIINEANQLHIQNVQTIKKARHFQTEQSQTRRQAMQRIQYRNERYNIEATIKKRQIQFRNRFLQERFKKELDEMISTNQ